MAEREGSLTKAVNLEVAIGLRRGSMNRVRDELASFEKLTAKIADSLAKKYKHLAPAIAKALRDEALQEERFQAKSIAKREREEQKSLYRRARMYEKVLRETHKFEESDDARHQRVMNARLKEAEKVRTDLRKASLLEQRRVSREALRQEQADMRSHMAAIRSMERQNIRQNLAANSAMRGDERGARVQRGLQGGWDRLGAQGDRAYAGQQGRGGPRSLLSGRGSMGGFIGLPGGLGGMYMAGPVGAAASIGVAAGTGLYQQGSQAAEGYRSSDMALRRMYSYVGSDERSRGNTFGSMKQRTLSLAARTGGSVEESANAMQEALTNMISPENAQSFAEMAQSLALMENVDLKETIKGMAAIKNAFELTEDEMLQVPDILAAAMQEGNVKIEGLSGVIGQTAQVAADAGKTGLQGLKDLSAGIAAFTLRGVPGEVASTSMRSIMMNIQNPSAKAKKVQEEIGYTATPSAARSHPQGAVGVLLELERAAKAKGRTMSEAFSGEARTQKILPLLLKENGKAVREALQFQENAISGRRMAGISDELNDTPSKRMDRLRAQNEISLNLAGEKTNFIFEGMAEAWSAFLSGMAGRDPMNEMRQAEFQARQDRKALEAGKTTPSALEAVVKRETAEWERKKELEIIKLDQASDANKALIEEVEKLYNKALPSLNKGLSAAGQGMDKWGARIVELTNLQKEANTAAQDRNAALDAASGDFGGVASIFGALAEEKKYAGLAATGKTASERVGFLEQKQAATMSFAGMDLESVANKGINDKDLEAYIESQITSKRLRGYEASKFRRETRETARGFQRQTEKGLLNFQKAGGAGDFAADFTRQRLGTGEGKIEGQIKTGMEKANASYGYAKADYEDYAKKIHDAEMSWTNIAAKIVEANESMKTLNTLNGIFEAYRIALDLGDALKAMKAGTVPVPTDRLKAEQERASPTKNQSDIDIQNIHEKLGMDNESGFVGPGSSNGVAKLGGTVYNQQKYNISVTVPEGTMDPEAVAQAVADKLRTNQERGRVTLTPAA